jgi:hypothetical protein
MIARHCKCAESAPHAEWRCVKCDRETPAPVPPASGLSDERLAEIGAALLAVLAETKQGHGVAVAYPDNKQDRMRPDVPPAPYGVMMWDGLWRWNSTDATKALAALLSRVPEERTRT